MKTVRVKNNVVVEIIPVYALPVKKWYGKQFAKDCIEAPDEVCQGWAYDGEVFYKPEPEPEPEPEPATDPVAQVYDELAAAYTEGVNSAYEQ